MLRIKVRFPLGVYHARSVADGAEWPPSPLRLIGALLAAAHGRQGVDPAEERALLQRLCEASAPMIVAPESVAVDAAEQAGKVVRLRGATRWVPRNYVTGPISPRNIGRERASVSKVGVAIGDLRISFVWPELDLDTVETERLAALAEDVTFLGTTRSPAILDVEAGEDDVETREVGETGPLEGEPDAWLPTARASDVAPDATVRVPDAGTIAAFDRRQRARHASGAKPQRAGMVPEIAIGAEAEYASPRRLADEEPPSDPHWWGEMIVLEVDREKSEVIPKAPAAYVLARALRVALLGAFEQAGTHGEAPPILRGRDAEPHCAIVPLPSVWGQHADGLIRAVAIVMPHEQRVPDLHVQRAQLELGLSELVGAPGAPARRFVALPEAGRLWLKLPDTRSTALASIDERRYREPAAVWSTVTPIVHSRWRKGGVDALLRQVSADCAHVGLPAPIEIELLRGPGRRGGAARVVPASRVPADWRGLLQGPSSHLRITFPKRVCGPLLIGRARHFGLGLCLPDAPRPESAGGSGEAA